MKALEGIELSELSPRLQGIIKYVFNSLYSDSLHGKDNLTISMGFSASDTLWLVGAAIECEKREPEPTIERDTNETN